MPSPGATDYINEAIRLSVAAGIISQEEVQTTTDRLMYLADRLENGDTSVVDELDQWGITMLPGGASLPGASPTAVPAQPPNMNPGGATPGGYPQGDYSAAPGDTYGPSGNTSTGSQSGLPAGWYTYKDPTTGRVLIINPQAKAIQNIAGEVVSYTPGVVATLIPPSSTAGAVTWGSPQFTADGHQIQVSSTGEIRVVPGTTAPNNSLTPYQSGQLAVSGQTAANTAAYQKGQLDLAGQRLGFDMTKWLQEQKDAADKLAAAQAALPQNLQYSNPNNPNEAAQRQDWMQRRMANGEDPYNWGDFQAHMEAIGAPKPEYNGFAASIQGFKLVQDRAQALADIQAQYDQQKALANQSYENATKLADQNYQHQVDILGIDSKTAELNRAESIRQADMQHQIALGQLGISQQTVDLNKQTAAIEAAKAGNPLDYLARVRGGASVPGANGTELYRGSGVTGLTAPAVNVYGNNTAGAPSLGLNAPSAAPSVNNVSPEDMADMRAQLAGANWPGGSDAEAFNAFMGVAKGDNPLKIKLLGSAPSVGASPTGASTGPSWNAPEMPPYIRAIQTGQPVAATSMPAGTNLRLPSIQQQANATPAETQALNNLASYVMPEADWAAQKANLRGSMGAGLSAGLMAPSSLRGLGRG